MFTWVFGPTELSLGLYDVQTEFRNVCKLGFQIESPLRDGLSLPMSRAESYGLGEMSFGR